MRRDEFSERGREQMNRVLGQMRIRNVALHAFHGQLARHRATAAILDHIAERDTGCRFPDDAVIQPFAACLECFDHLDGAVRCRAFFVARDQERERATVRWMRRDEFLARYDERRYRCLHIRRTTPVQLAVAMGRNERRRRPLFERPGRHDIGVAGEREQLAIDTVRAALDGPEISDAARGDRFTVETNCRQPLDQQVLAMLVVGRNGRARDELFGEKKGAGHGFEPLSIKNAGAAAGRDQDSRAVFRRRALLRLKLKRTAFRTCRRRNPAISRVRSPQARAA